MSQPDRSQRPLSLPSTLFEIPSEPVPEVPGAHTPLVGVPRLRTAVRDQIVFRSVALDDLIPTEHTARVIWEYVVGLDLTVLFKPIKEVQRRPGRSPIDPRILLAL